VHFKYSLLHVCEMNAGHLAVLAVCWAALQGPTPDSLSGKRKDTAM